MEVSHVEQVVDYSVMTGVDILMVSVLLGNTVQRLCCRLQAADNRKRRLGHVVEIHAG